MSRSVITVEDLSKYYRLGVISGATLREDLSRWLAKKRNKPDPLAPIGQQEGQYKQGELWALKGINLDIKEGDIVGIIGRNGAGKSTLLKILSRITAPTSGRAIIRGRVGSLLEVGTGFHPELTGRENIFLNGAILGMSKFEVSRKLEEIVAFAEVEKFIDTPVKRYSSGMIVRLGFAVAAHLEPEILIIDEVLAVGDAMFQKRCLGKIKDVAGHGRTVLFVSHNMGSIGDLCTKAVLIDEGAIKNSGNTKEIIEQYLLTGLQTVPSRQWSYDSAPGDSACKLMSVEVRQAGRHNISTALITSPINIYITVDIENPADEIGITLLIHNSEGKLLVHTTSAMNRELRKLAKGRHSLTATLPAYLLNSGSYSISIASDIPFKRVMFHENNTISFDVTMDCKEMGRYPEAAWRGLTGAGICSWDKAISH